MSKTNDSPLERDECIPFAHWLTLKKLPFTHIANESGLPSKVAFIVSSKKKGLGVSKGFPDYLVVTPKGIVFVEMKRQKGGQVSPEQKAWLEILQSIDGVEARVCKGFDEAKAFIEEFL